MRRLHAANPARLLVAAAIAAVAGVAAAAQTAPTTTPPPPAAAPVAPTEPAPASPPTSTPGPTSEAPPADAGPVLKKDLPEHRPRAGRPDSPPTAGAIAKRLTPMLARLGRDDAPVTAPGIVLWSPGDRTAAAALAVRLDRSLGEMRRLLRVQRGGAAPRAVVLHAERDAFELAEATLFMQAPLRSRIAVLHELDGTCVIDAWESSDEPVRRGSLGRTLATSLLLDEPTIAAWPTWFREGLASQLAVASISPNGLEPIMRRAGLSAIRGGRAAGLLGIPPEDPAWIDLASTAQGVAFLAVQWLAEQRPRDLDRLVDALRREVPFDDALRQASGLTASGLSAALARHYAVND